MRHLSVVFILSIGLAGCAHLPTCKTSQLQTNARSLRGIWNTLKYIKGKKMKQRWAARFLDQLLGGTPYQIKASGKRYVIVDPSDSDHPCRVNINTQQRQVQDTQFLAKLYQFKQNNKLNLKSYTYSPPREYTVHDNKVRTSGGNCRSTNYRVEFYYWKSISTKYSQRTWKEACKIGQKLRAWESCFPKKYKALYQKRMKIICK